jgi:hypothetical protein
MRKRKKANVEAVADELYRCRDLDKCIRLLNKLSPSDRKKAQRLSDDRIQADKDRFLLNRDSLIVRSPR